eukprot:145263-Pleurochrysis_carterae.AAC.1
MSFRNVGQTKRVLARPYSGGSPVGGGARMEVPRDGECGARRRRDDGSVVNSGASLQQPLVHGVPQDVMRVSPTVSPVVV